MPAKIKIPVKIGSHLTHVGLNDKIDSCDEFIRVALIQCNLIKCANQYLNTYALFERLHGIEVMIDASENMLNLWSSKWSTLINDANFSLIIKKFKKSEVLCKFIEKNEKRMHKLFEISKQMSLQNIPSECGDNKMLSQAENARPEKLKLKLQTIAGKNEYSTSDDSGTTKISGSSGSCLIRKAGKSNEKKKFLKKLICKTDAHAKSLLKNFSNSSFLSLAKSKKCLNF